MNVSESVAVGELQPGMFPVEGIHIVNGSSAAGALLQSFKLAERVIPHNDILSCGPTPRCSSIEEWEQLRWNYLQPLSTGLPFHSYRDFGLLHESERLIKCAPIFVWASVGLEEQLMIAYLVHLLDILGGDAGQVRLMQFEKEGTHWSIRCMAELRPEEWRRHPQPAPLSQAHLAECRAAWSALTSPSPQALVDFSASSVKGEALPRAMRCMLTRYPDKASGLGYWDRLLLSHVRQVGEKVARVVGGTMTHDIPRGYDMVGDITLFHRLLKLADESLPAPLLAYTGDRGEMRGAQVSLTSFGREVLEGRKSFLDENPIDEWIGGVHLDSAKGILWFFDDLIGVPDS